MSVLAIAVLVAATCELLMATPLVRKVRDTGKVVRFTYSTLRHPTLADERKERRVLRYSRMLLVLSLSTLALLALYALPWGVAMLAMPQLAVTVADSRVVLAVTIFSILYIWVRVRLSR